MPTNPDRRSPDLIDFDRLPTDPCSESGRKINTELLRQLLPGQKVNKHSIGSSSSSDELKIFVRALTALLADYKILERGTGEKGQDDPGRPRVATAMGLTLRNGPRSKLLLWLLDGNIDHRLHEYVRKVERKIKERIAFFKRQERLRHRHS